MKLEEWYKDAFYYLDVDIPARDWKYFNQAKNLFKVVEENPTVDEFLKFSEQRQEILWDTLDKFFKAHDIAPELYMGFAEMIFPPEASRFIKLYQSLIGEDKITLLNEKNKKN